MLSNSESPNNIRIQVTTRKQLLRCIYSFNLKINWMYDKVDV